MAGLGLGLGGISAYGAYIQGNKPFAAFRGATVLFGTVLIGYSAGRHYVENLAAPQASEPLGLSAPQTPPSQGRINQLVGNEFENAVAAALRAEINTQKVPDNVPGRGPLNTEPDLFNPNDPSQFGVTDIKNELTISFDQQLQAQFDVASQNGVPFNLIISPKTRSVSIPLQNAIRNTGGRIWEFDPASGSFGSVRFNPRWGNQVSR